MQRLQLSNDSKIQQSGQPTTPTPQQEFFNLQLTQMQLFALHRKTTITSVMYTDSVWLKRGKICHCSCRAACVTQRERTDISICWYVSQHDEERGNTCRNFCRPLAACRHRERCSSQSWHNCAPAQMLHSSVTPCWTRPATPTATTFDIRNYHIPSTGSTIAFTHSTLLLLIENLEGLQCIWGLTAIDGVLLPCE